ncbi:unnamed protein product [Peniophora sp. CBMAI 1063]|nr:unnamed protein product [Peniophora sp. CBMAI 1063]
MSSINRRATDSLDLSLAEDSSPVDSPVGFCNPDALNDEAKSLAYINGSKRKPRGVTSREALSGGEAGVTAAEPTTVGPGQARNESSGDANTHNGCLPPPSSLSRALALVKELVCKLHA